MLSPIIEPDKKKKSASQLFGVSFNYKKNYIVEYIHPVTEIMETLYAVLTLLKLQDKIFDSHSRLQILQKL